MQIPPFMLKKIFVKGSLTFLEGGLAFTLINPVAPAHLVGINSLILNDKDYTENVIIRLSDKAIPGKDLSNDNALHFGLKEKAVIHVPEAAPDPGNYEITIVLQTREVGPLNIQASERLDAE